MQDFIISLKDVSFSYESEENTTEVLHDISLDIKKGQFVAVLGHNGCGKSTLAKLFNAVLIPQQGKVLVKGVDTSDEDKLLDIRRNVGMVFQNPDNQIVASVVEEDVAFALENLGVEPTEIRQRVDDALKAVGMYEYRESAPYRLSGGQKQRIAIAGTIAMRPDCIVLDEPTAMLDPHGRREVMKTVHELNEKFGITVILITHYMDEAATADRVIVMNDGKVILDDEPKKVFWNVNLLKNIGLDVPQSTEIIYDLREEGKEVAGYTLTAEECADQISQLLDKKGVIKKCL